MNKLTPDFTHKIAITASKLKRLMQKKHKRHVVVDVCPFCKGKETLNGWLSKKDARGRQPFRMACLNPECKIMMME